VRRVVAHAFVDDLARPVLTERDVHHFGRVLRLRPGETVSVSDGKGGTRLCQWLGDGLGLLTAPSWEPPPHPLLTVGFALTKGDNPDWAVQKLTEAGVDRVVLIVSDRCVARWRPGQEDRQLDRLREIARQAAMQSRRSWLPLVDGPVPFPALVPAERGQTSGDIALAVQGGVPLALSTPTVLVGPEGGWSDEELAAVPEARRIGLGPNVLRAETAAVAAGLILAALRAGLVLPAVPRPTSSERGGA
jgi:16S rRNA (uracil1498-N3)-methyltransferase